MKFMLCGTEKQLSPIKRKTTFSEWVRETVQMPVVRHASPGFDGNGQITIEQSANFEEPQKDWFTVGINHKQIGLRTWTRGVEKIRYAIEIVDLMDLITFLIEHGAHLEVISDPPEIVFQKPHEELTFDSDDDRWSDD